MIKEKCTKQMYPQCTCIKQYIALDHLNVGGSEVGGTEVDVIVLRAGQKTCEPTTAAQNCCSHTVGKERDGSPVMVEQTLYKLLSFITLYTDSPQGSQ